ncbi:MAG: hypothetical protein ACE5OS_13375, partial [Anaerolineae bacterium]
FARLADGDEVNIGGASTSQADWNDCCAGFGGGGIYDDNTSFVARINLTLRHLVSRLHRKTLCFSKRCPELVEGKREYLMHHLHLALACYHFTRYHAGLRVKLPEPIPIAQGDRVGFAPLPFFGHALGARGVSWKHGATGNHRRCCNK